MNKQPMRPTSRIHWIRWCDCCNLTMDESGKIAFASVHDLLHSEIMIPDRIYVTNSFCDPDSTFGSYYMVFNYIQSFVCMDIATHVYLPNVVKYNKSPASCNKKLGVPTKWEWELHLHEKLSCNA